MTDSGTPDGPTEPTEEHRRASDGGIWSAPPPMQAPQAPAPSPADDPTAAGWAAPEATQPGWAAPPIEPITTPVGAPPGAVRPPGALPPNPWASSAPTGPAPSMPPPSVPGPTGPGWMSAPPPSGPPASGPAPGWWLASDGNWYPPPNPWVPQGPGYPNMYGAPQATAGTNSFAIASLVLGIVWIFWIGSVLSVIFGFVALSQIKHSQGRQGGRGLAIAGIILAFLWFVVLIASIATSSGTNTGGGYGVLLTGLLR